MTYRTQALATSRCDQIARLALIGCALFACTRPPASEVNAGHIPTKPTRLPQQFDVKIFGKASLGGSHVLPSHIQLTNNERVSLAAAARTHTDDFAPYLFSGCHNRAHANFLLLPQPLKDKAMKIWVISPGAYSAGFFGLIGITQDLRIQWGFHVALAFNTSSGVIVWDSALAPGMVVDLESWFSKMRVPPLSLWTLTAAYVFQFKTATVVPLDNYSPVNPTMWSGDLLVDEPQNPINRDMLIGELARDRIGADALQGKACKSLIDSAVDPAGLQRILAAPPAPGCEASSDRFAAEQTRLRKLIEHR